MLRTIEVTYGVRYLEGENRYIHETIIKGQYYFAYFVRGLDASRYVAALNSGKVEL